MRDGVERALLVRDLAAVPDREPEREHADDRVDEPAGDEPGAREHFEGAECDEAVAGVLAPDSRLARDWLLMSRLLSSLPIVRHVVSVGRLLSSGETGSAGRRERRR